MLKETLKEIQPLDVEAMRQAQDHLNQLTKPQGSLGKLEQLSIQLAGITGEVRPVFEQKRIVIMAADHGVVEEGVSAFPQEVTGQMILNFLHGGAAINVIARQTGAEVVCVDVGTAADLGEPEGLVCRKVAYGSKNMRREKALTREEVIRAIEAGIEVAIGEADKGVPLFATGEMGIGNTTPSSAILAAFTGHSVAEVVGRGTGITSDALSHKIDVIEKTLALHQPNPNDPFDVLEKVGGLEICALAGLIIGAASRRIPVVVDGFISTVAALTAVKLCPAVRPYLIASHQSEEPGHRLVLQELGLEPMLQAHMRLGEGTGAALMFPIIDTAQRIMREMATFAEAGVANK